MLLRYILIFIFLLSLCTTLNAQQNPQSINFETNYKYALDIANDNFTSNRVYTKWALHSEPILWLEMNEDGDSRKYRIDEMNVIRKEPEKNTYEIIHKDIDQKWQFTYYKGNPEGFKITIYFNEQTDGSYKQVLFYTSFQVSDLVELLD